jgi:hypothetical protein
MAAYNSLSEEISGGSKLIASERNLKGYLIK